MGNKRTERRKSKQKSAAQAYRGLFRLPGIPPADTPYAGITRIRLRVQRNPAVSAVAPLRLLPFIIARDEGECQEGFSSVLRGGGMAASQTPKSPCTLPLSDNLIFSTLCPHLKVPASDAQHRTGFISGKPRLPYSFFTRTRQASQTTRAAGSPRSISAQRFRERVSQQRRNRCR